MEDFLLSKWGQIVTIMVTAPIWVIVIFVVVMVLDIWRNPKNRLKKRKDEHHDHIRESTSAKKS